MATLWVPVIHECFGFKKISGGSYKVGRRKKKKKEKGQKKKKKKKKLFREKNYQ